MHKNFLSKNIIGLLALTVGVMLIIGFVVANDESPVANNATISTQQNNPNLSEENTTPDQDTSTQPAAKQSDTNTDDAEPADSTTVDEASDTSEKSTDQDKAAATEQEKTTQLSTKEVAGHNSASDCWTIVEGSVYDITDYIPRHPGGDEILRACGADGTSLFQDGVTESGEQVKSRGGHSAGAEAQLSELLLGPLQN